MKYLKQLIVLVVVISWSTWLWFLIEHANSRQSVIGIFALIVSVTLFMFTVRWVLTIYDDAKSISGPKPENVIWVKTQKDGTRLGQLGPCGQRWGWTVCGDSDTENYCRDMANDLNIPFVGVFKFGDFPGRN